MGLVDEFRQRKPSFAEWRALNEPARVTLEWNPDTASGLAPTGFRATIARRGADELPSYELSGYRLRWQLRDGLGALVASGTRDLPVMGGPQTIDASWTPGAPFGLTLAVELVRPTGVVAVDRALTWYLSRIGWAGREGHEDAGALRIAARRRAASAGPRLERPRRARGRWYHAPSCIIRPHADHSNTGDLRRLHRRLRRRRRHGRQGAHARPAPTSSCSRPGRMWDSAERLGDVQRGPTTRRAAARRRPSGRSASSTAASAAGTIEGEPYTRAPGTQFDWFRGAHARRPHEPLGPHLAALRPRRLPAQEPRRPRRRLADHLRRPQAVLRQARSADRHLRDELRRHCRTSPTASSSRRPSRAATSC